MRCGAVRGSGRPDRGESVVAKGHNEKRDDGYDQRDRYSDEEAYRPWLERHRDPFLWLIPRWVGGFASIVIAPKWRAPLVVVRGRDGRAQRQAGPLSGRCLTTSRGICHIIAAYELDALKTYLGR